MMGIAVSSNKPVLYDKEPPPKLRLKTLLLVWKRPKEGREGICTVSEKSRGKFTTLGGKLIPKGALLV